MVSCLILYHSTITIVTKCKVLRAIFHKEYFEIDVMECNTVVIYIWNIEKARIWQAALDFESSNVMTGYGFGESKNNANKSAMKILLKRVALSGESEVFSSFTIKDDSRTTV